LIGLSGQYAAVDEHLTAMENLEMIGCLYGMRRRASRKKASELIERFRLSEAANRPLKTFSGGMRRRIDLAGALLADPPVLFLDEPTTGLDPRSRGELWDVIRERVDAGTTVILTTQYLEEADQLAHDIVVIDHGRAIARGTSQELKRRIGGEHLDIHLALLSDLSRVEDIVRPFAIGAIRTEDQDALISIPVAKGVEALGLVMVELTAQNVEILDIGLRRPTLDDVFMELTGKKTKEEES
jgi:ABC-2 type transport system ATP-binding protein